MTKQRLWQIRLVAAGRCQTCGKVKEASRCKLTRCWSCSIKMTRRRKSYKGTATCSICFDTGHNRKMHGDT